MRTYEEKAQSVLHRIEEEKEIRKKRKKKRTRGAALIMSFCLVVAAAFGTIKAGQMKLMSAATAQMETEACLPETAQRLPGTEETPMEAEPELEEEPMEAVAAPPEACYPDEPMEDVVARSSLAVSGKITACSERFGIKPTFGGDPMPYYDWTFTIEETYRGESETDTITVRTGQDLEAYLSVGDSVLLFLYQPHMGGGYNAEGDYYYIASVVNGIYTMEYTDDGIALRDSTGMAVDWESFQEELQAQSALHPVNELRALNDYLFSVQRNAEENQYAPTMEEALADIEQYAEIVPLP